MFFIFIIQPKPPLPASIMSLRGWIKKFPLRHYVAGLTLELVTSILRTGPVPQHVAFIMDGNRRFAKQHNLELGEGHVAGFESLSNVYKPA